MKEKFSLKNRTTNEIIEYCHNVWHKPVAEEFFNIDKNIKCVVVAVGQYYNDEAKDAVHVKFIPLSNEFSSWEECFTKNSFVKNGHISSYCGPKTEAYKKVFGEPYGPYPDNNENYIKAFSPLCHEGCYEDMEDQEAYNPITIFTKTDDGKINIRRLDNIIKLLKD